MTFSLFLVWFTTAIWFWLARKPDPVIGLSLNTLMSSIPILRLLWARWLGCAFCGGFWIALGLQALTDTQIVGLGNDAWYWKGVGFVLGALATAFASACIVLVVDLGGAVLGCLSDNNSPTK